MAEFHDFIFAAIARALNRLAASDNQAFAAAP